MNNVINKAACAMVAGLALFAASADAEQVTGVVVSDSQITPNHDSGTNPNVPLYAMVKGPTPTFQFNQHYSQMPIKWTLELPEELEGTNYQITSASVLAYLTTSQTGLWNPDSGQLKLFATGFSGESQHTLENWSEASTYFGPSAAVGTPLQDPYLVELGTNARAEDNLNATPWAVGEIDPVYDGTAIPTEAVPVRFYFDVNNLQIRDYLKNGLDNGVIMFTMAATYPAGMPGGGGPSPSYPRIATRESVGNPDHGTIQKAPTLTIDVAAQASARNWHLY